MKFKVLQDNLRKTLWSRIEEGNLTGLGLARQTGFKQAHISNFLNRKRGLSIEGMDKVMNVQRLSVLDLLDPAEINKRASILPPSEDEFENVLQVEDQIAASSPILMSRHVKDMLKFKKSFLHNLRPQMEGDRQRWERFVLIRANAREGMSMYPRLLPGATVLIDRHYNSLKAYRKEEPNMYVVHAGQSCVIRYVELAENHLVLRPQNPAYPVDVISIGAGMKASDHITGRVCYVGMET